MVPSCCLWKLVTFFGKEHVDWFSISGVTVGRSWTIKSIIFLVNFSKLDFLTSSSDKSLILDQLTCYLPKNVTSFHGEQVGIIHFCLNSYKMGVFGTLNLQFDKKMDFSKLDFSTSSYHNSTNFGPVCIFFIKNQHYFSPAFQICQETWNFFIN